jgi:hypothetical protein
MADRRRRCPTDGVLVCPSERTTRGRQHRPVARFPELCERGRLMSSLLVGKKGDRSASPETRLGTVVLFEASEDTVDLMQALLTEAGASQSLLRCPLADLKRGITDFRKYLDQHNPEVVIVDLSPPYAENWAFFITMRDAVAMEGRGIVLTTTSKQRLDEVIGEDSHAFEVVGTQLDHALILEEIKVATLLARIARRRTSDGAL